MSKMLEATCADGVVKVGDLVVECTILTQGTAPSSGLLFLNEDRKFYVATNTTDIMDLLDIISGSLNTIASALTAIGGGMTGPTTAPPPSLPASVAQVTNDVADLQSLMEELK